MSKKKTIRIVKKGKGTRPTAKPKITSTGEATRVLVGTVTNWVSEFQQRRLSENAIALRILPKRPSEAN